VGGSTLLASRRVHDGFMHVVGDLAEPCLMIQVHVTIDDVTAERRISEHVVDRLQITQYDKADEKAA
jgi:hypothetical protein